MAAAGVGYFFARRGGYSATMLGFAFVAAPIFALFHKRELDYYENTTNAMYHMTNKLAFIQNNSHKNSQSYSNNTAKSCPKLKIKSANKNKFSEHWKISIMIDSRQLPFPNDSFFCIPIPQLFIIKLLIKFLSINIFNRLMIYSLFKTL